MHKYIEKINDFIYGTCVKDNFKLIVEPFVFLWLKEKNRDNFLNYLRNSTFNFGLFGFCMVLSLMPIYPALREIISQVGIFICFMAFLANSWFLIDKFIHDYDDTFNFINKDYNEFSLLMRITICIVIITFFGFMFLSVSNTFATSYLKSFLEGIDLLPKYFDCIDLFDTGKLEQYSQCIRK